MTSWLRHLAKLGLAVGLTGSSTLAAAGPPSPLGEAALGITVGPIESTIHPDAGYGTDKGRAAIVEAKNMGANWVALTPFGRIYNLDSTTIDLKFEAEVADNTRAMRAAIRDAHSVGLRVFLVPHLWVESGGWRALIHPDGDRGWEAFAQSYERFVSHWAHVAAEEHVDMMSVGVELRRWVTTNRAGSFERVIAAVRHIYDGPLTYSANWDDVDDTLIWSKLDLIGVNAFYPLTTKKAATVDELIAGGERVAEGLARTAAGWNKPIIVTEMGYTTRADPALKPWEWPDHMSNVQVDEAAQARAYRGLLAPLRKRSFCAGFFVWRTYADPSDVSQEAAWGFSPRGKLAELELRDAFIAQWAVDDHGLDPVPWSGRQRARHIGVYSWSLSPKITWRMP